MRFAPHIPQGLLILTLLALSPPRFCVHGRNLTYQNPLLSSSFAPPPDSLQYPTLLADDLSLKNVSSRASCTGDSVLCDDGSCHSCTLGGILTCCKVGGGACCTGSTCTTPPAGAKSQCCPTGNTNCPTGGCCRPGTTCCGDGCVASNEGCCLVITNNLTVSTGSCPKPVGECCASGPSAGLCYNSTTDYCCENVKNICPSGYICCGEKECCDPEFETCQSGTCVTTSSTPGPSPTSAAAATALSFGLAGWVLLNIFIVKVDLRLLYTA
ncbi:hypothetical protein B0H13DRAFT_2012553 [Mycena leptocephala]|nr:hypothetical protein B0H13DRAFT_2012553 [Mycena leptocephala]